MHANVSAIRPGSRANDYGGSLSVSRRGRRRIARENGKDSAVIVAGIGAVALVLSAAMGMWEPRAARVAQASSHTIDLQAQQYKAYIEARSTTCKSISDWFGDDTPNPLLAKEEVRLLNEDMRLQFKSCLVPPPAPPLLTSNITPSVQPATEKYEGGGGNSDGGGSSARY